MEPKNQEFEADPSQLLLDARDALKQMVSTFCSVVIVHKESFI